MPPRSTREVAQVVDIIARHLSGRRDALRAVALMGYRFENWFKYEAAISLTNALALDPRPWFGCVQVEGEGRCDLFVGKHEWTAGPTDWERGPCTEDDLWIELKVRTTWWQGATELAGDLEKARDRVANRTVGRKLVLALVLRYPRVGIQDDLAVERSRLEGRLGVPVCSHYIQDRSLNEGLGTGGRDGMLLAWTA